MRERPILFSGAMVRAILGGQKTQTRRIVKQQPPDGWDRHCWYTAPVFGWTNEPEPAATWHKVRCPYGQSGDRLWVREAWRIGAWDEDEGAFAIDYCDGPQRKWLTDPTDHDCLRFSKLWIQCTDELIAKGIPPGADGLYRWEPGQSPLRWRPSIHMPRWASRITLEITGVRVERLQDISEEDALAEGIVCENVIVGSYYANGHKEVTAGRFFFDGCSDDGFEDAVDAYAALWESINGAGAWDANPWVWVVEFQKL